jgi:uncharacterized damage-inducible protein DinB
MSRESGPKPVESRLELNDAAHPRNIRTSARVLDDAAKRVPAEGSPGFVRLRLLTGLMPPTELPAQVTHGGERETLESFLDYHRAVFVRKMHGLDPTQLAVTVGASPLTLGGLWHHMALVEDIWFRERLLGLPLPEPWASAPFDDDPDWDFTSAPTFTPTEVAARFDAAVERSRATLAASTSLERETVIAGRDGRTRSLRWVLVHLIEEYARHCGHADLLRETVDGHTGD